MKYRGRVQRNCALKMNRNFGFIGSLNAETRENNSERTGNEHKRGARQRAVRQRREIHVRDMFPC